MQTYHEWDAEGKHYRAVIDEAYQPERSCGGAKGKHGEGHSQACLNGGMEKFQLAGRDGQLQPEEEALRQDVCERFYQNEVEMLNSGQWVALGVILSEPCKGVTDVLDSFSQHCECCAGRKETDALWGIVVENSHEAIERFVKGEGM